MIGIILSTATLTYLLINYFIRFYSYFDCNLLLNLITITIKDHHHVIINCINTHPKIIDNYYDNLIHLQVNLL